MGVMTLSPPPLSKVKRLLGIVLIGVLLTACGDDDEPDTNKKEEDKPENTAPMIADQTFSIAEDAAVDTEVGTVQAADAENDNLTFSISSGNTGDVFALNAGEGLLTVAKALDFETDSIYTLKVSVSDGTDANTADITINITDVEEIAPGTRLPDREFDLAMDNNSPSGLWSDGTTIWVINTEDFDVDAKLYAYTLATGARDAAKEFDVAEENEDPSGMWSDGNTMWVLDESVRITNDDGSTFYRNYGKIYAYALTDGTREVDNEFDLAEENETSYIGIWSDGTTMWVADDGYDSDLDAYGDAKLYAYTLATGARDAAKEFDLAEENEGPSGIWSDGTTIWVVDDGYDPDSDDYVKDAKLYAYTLATGARDAAKEFDLAEENELPYDIWSDGTTLWVADDGYDPDSDQTTRDAKIYAYQLK